MTAYEQRSYAGAAADTLLNADITNSATSFSVTPGSGTGYPDGSGGPFFVIIDWDTSKAEKIRCSGRVNDTFTVAGSGGGRGQDGTSAQAHTANAKVRHVITATDVQEANRAAANTVGKVTTKGDLLVGTGANTLARVGAGTDGQVVSYDSTQATGVRPVTLDYTGSWVSYTPSVAGITNLGDLVGRYKQVGKTVTYHVFVQTSGTSAFSGTFTFGLPVASLNNGRGFMQVGTAWCHDAVNFPYLGGAVVTSAGGSTIQVAGASGGYWGASSPFAWSASLNEVIAISGTYESA